MHMIAPLGSLFNSFQGLDFDTEEKITYLIS